MGQQQVLLILVGVVIVGLAIVVGISLWHDAAEQSNREAIVHDLQYLASSLVQAYMTPEVSAGLQGNYHKLYKDPELKILKKNRKKNPSTSPEYYWETDNGKYEFVKVTTDSVVLRGEGLEIGRDKVNPVTAYARMGASSFEIEITN